MQSVEYLIEGLVHVVGESDRQYGAHAGLQENNVAGIDLSLGGNGTEIL